MKCTSPGKRTVWLVGGGRGEERNRRGGMAVYGAEEGKRERGGAVRDRSTGRKERAVGRRKVTRSGTGGLPGFPGRVKRITKARR